MASPHGVAGQFGYKSEETVGTAVTVDTFLPLLSESIEQEIERLESESVRAGRLVTAVWKPGQKVVSGDIELELWNTDIAPLLRHCLGGHDVSGSGPFTHEFTPGDLSGKGLTIQVGRPDQQGTVRAFTWSGCKVDSWTLSADVGEIAQLTLGIVALEETTETSLASASYDEGLEPFTFVEGAVSIAGSSSGKVESFEITGENGLEERFRLGSAVSREYLENAIREYAGTMTVDFDDLSEYERYVSGAEFALELAFSNGTETLKVTCNVRYDGSSPSLDGPELLQQDLPFKAWHGATDAQAITVELVNDEETAA